MVTGVTRRIKGGERELGHYFDAVRERFASVQRAAAYRPDEITLGMAGRLVGVNFGTRQMEERLMPSLEYLRVYGQAPQDGRLYFWQDDPANCCPDIPKDHFDEELWRHESQAAEIFVPVHKTFYRGWHFAGQEFFHCLPAGRPLGFFHTTHPLRLLWHAWARGQGLCLVHGAAVEINGCGVFIGSAGGRGKSSLAVASLLAGHFFAGDDYVFIDAAGSAHMLYSTAYLLPDMLEKMPALHGRIIGRDPERNNKTLFGLDEYEQNLKKTIPLHIFISPQFAPTAKPEIYPVSKARPLWRTIDSTAVQNDAANDRTFRKTMFDRLSRLAVFEFHMSPDLNANMAILEDFTTRWKEHVQIER